MLNQKENIRDVILFLSGLAGVAYETLTRDQPRIELLVVFIAMMGLPVTLLGDRKARKDEDA